MFHLKGVLLVKGNYRTDSDVYITLLGFYISVEVWLVLNAVNLLFLTSEFTLELLSGVKDGPETTFKALTSPKFSSMGGLAWSHTVYYTTVYSSNIFLMTAIQK